MARIGEHAVVLGASMGGLLAARVLTDFYDRVTVVERDELTDLPDARRGVPQGRQPHVLLARCGQVMEELFPGILDDLIAEGAHRWSDGDLTRFHVFFGGHLIKHSGAIPQPAALVNHYASRPFIECHVRRRVRALPTVTMLDGHEIGEPIATGQRITGVTVLDRSGGVARTLSADLVIDATGRGSRTPAFLDRLGYGRPREDELTVRVAYASMPARIPDGTLHEHVIARQFEPGRPRGFVMFRCEKDTWVIGAGTLGGLAPPTNRADLVDFGAEFVPAHALAAMREAEPLADVSVHQFPANRWRRYDQMSRLPDGLVVVGDAVCSFNPIYGQGMTIASIESLILRDCLRQGDDELPRRFARAAAKKIRLAWQTAVGSDLALPEVAGNRTLSVRLTNALVDRILAAAESDPYVVQQFMRVTGMLDGPIRLLRPNFVYHVARASRRRRLQPRSEAVGVS